MAGCYAEKLGGAGVAGSRGRARNLDQAISNSPIPTSAAGCETLGVDGCEQDGGIDPEVKVKALAHNLAE